MTKEQAIERARDQYALGSDDNIEIDDNPETSQAENGIWVQAWVWVEDETGTEE